MTTRATTGTPVNIFIGYSKEEAKRIKRRRQQARNIIDTLEHNRPAAWDGLEPFDEGWEEAVDEHVPSPESETADKPSHHESDRDNIARLLTERMQAELDPGGPHPDLTPEEQAALDAADRLRANPTKKSFTNWLHLSLVAAGCPVTLPEGLNNSVDCDVEGQPFRIQVSMPRKKKEPGA